MLRHEAGPDNENAQSVALPDWFDPQLVDLLEKKLRRKKSFVSVLDRITFLLLEFVVRPVGWSYVRPVAWADLEMMMQHDCDAITANGYAPDVIVGIESGGAFIANFVAKCLGVQDVSYVRVESYSPIFDSTVLAFMTRFLRRARLTLRGDLDVKGKRVLLVDDQVYTGKSLQAARECLEQAGAATVKTYCVYVTGSTTDFAGRSGRMNYVPWGDDP